MAGTKAGALKTKETNLRKFGSDYYKRIGALGGSVNRPESRSFYLDREFAKQASAKGHESKRRKANGDT